LLKIESLVRRRSHVDLLREGRRRKESSEPCGNFFYGVILGGRSARPYTKGHVRKLRDYGSEASLAAQVFEWRAGGDKIFLAKLSLHPDEFR